MVKSISWPRLYLCAAAGGMLGSLLRYGVALAGPGMQMGGFPWASVLVNVLGSLMIGFLAAVSQPEGRWPMSPHQQAFWLAGVCGGFTTFSFFSLELALLLQAANWVGAGIYLGLSLSGWLLAVWLGFRLGQQLYKS
jgi:fluoride exporter